jgi:two-component system KDP operon response regulator KdpE
MTDITKEVKARILVVDDEPALRQFLRATLLSQNFQVFEASTGQGAVSAATEHRPDIVILDLGLPDIDGVEVIHILREWTQIPIIILSVRDAESEKIAALNAGADDYLTKPFGLGELIARVGAALRRSTKVKEVTLFSRGDLKVDLAKRKVMVAGKDVQLTPNEYDLLKVLVLRAGRVITHRQLLREVWGAEYGDELHMLHVNISNLRSKIEKDSGHPRLIVTEPGVGYRLKDD